MSEHGKVADVTTHRVGVEVVEASTGLTLAVDNATPLEEDGGQLTLYGQVVDYAAVDMEADTVTLAAPLTVDVGDRLELFPPKVHTVATVRLDDDDEPVEATVPLGLRMRIPDGIRDDPDRAETVLLDWSGESLEVVEVVGDDGHVKTLWPIAPGGAFVAGDPEGARTEMSDTGIYVYRVGPNGLPYATTSMTSSETAVNVIGEDGVVLGGINSLGDVHGRRLTANESLRIRGTDLLGTLSGSPVPGWLDQLPRGIVPGTYREIPTDNESIAVVTNLEALSLGVTAPLLPGRRYRIVAAARFRAGVAGGVVSVRIRRADGSAPLTTSSPIVGHNGYSATASTATHAPYIQAEAFHSVETARKVQFRMTFQGYYGATPTRVGGLIYVEDVGPMSASAGGGDDAPPDQTLYQSTWTATAARRYDAAGNAISGSAGQIDLWYWFSAPHQYENAAVVFGGGAVTSTDEVELGKTLSSALNGATIHKAEIYLHNKTWYSDDEGHTALSTLAGTTLPNSGLTIDGTLYVPKFPAGSGVWVEVPPAWFLNGANRGVKIGDKDGYTLPGGPPAAPLISGAMHGIGDPNPPQARFTYSR